MKKLIFALICAAVAISASAQTRDVRIPTEQNEGEKFVNLPTLKKGFYFATELSGVYSISHDDNFGIGELDVVGGYRFNEYIRVGIGIGARYYINNSDYKIRQAWSDWGLPLYVNLRGNFISSTYRTVTPYWSVDVGTSFPDGVMFRPSVGIRVGQERSAFLLALTYSLQSTRVWDEMIGGPTGTTHTSRSFLGVKVGYEF
jgi:opacity protein-like surface antigen